MKYQSVPSVVTASAIRDVGPHEADGSRTLGLEDGRTIAADDDLLAASIVPVPGDYFVERENGSAFLCDKYAFEESYSPLEALADPAGSDLGSIDSLPHELT